MKLIRYAHPQSQTSSTLNRLFDLGTPTLERFGSLMDGFMPTEAGERLPAMDLYEDVQNYYACFEVPGVKKDEIDLQLDKGVLTLRTVELSQEEAKGSTTRFKRSVSLPEGIDLEQVSAALNHGILAVTMPKLAAGKPLKISVK